jgi:ribA/ribD-fused uncharacterized protein
VIINSFHGKHRFLSNFWLVRVKLNGRAYPSVENAYQAAKTLDADVRHSFEHCSPGEAKKLGKGLILRQDWSDVKVPIMHNLLTQKFARGSLLAQQLIDTGDAHLEEGNTWGDTFWGVCRGKGDNRLGELLMNIRTLLQSNSLFE